MANLTTSQIKKWKKSVDSAITTTLVASLKNVNSQATQLNKITASVDSDLAPRYKDLATLASAAQKKLTTFMNSFNTEIDKYVSATEAAAQQAAAATQAGVDQFAEKAAEINKLKM